MSGSSNAAVPAHVDAYAAPSTLAHRITAVLPSLSYALLFIGIALAPFNVYRFRGSIIASDAFLMAAGVLLAIDLLAGRTRLWLPATLAFAASIVTLGFMGATLARSGNIPQSGAVTFIILFYTAYLLPVIIASQRITDARQVRVLIYTWLIATIVQAAVITCQSQGVAFPGFIEEKLVRGAGRSAGLTMHPNVAGLFVVLPVPIGFACALSAKRWLSALAWLACTGLMMYAIDQTGSRAALVGAFMSCAIVSMLFVLFRSRARWLRTTMVLAIALLVSVSLFGGGTESAFNRLFHESESSTAANEVRQQLDDKFKAYFYESPAFGNGYEVSGIHNVFVGTLGIAGLFGLLALILRESTYVIVALRLLRSLRSSRGDFGLAVGLAVVDVVWLAMFVKGYVLFDRPGFIGIGLMALFYLHRSGEERNQPIAPFRARPPLRP